MSKKRACGSRKAGGVYAETKLSPRGQPIEFFIVDPPKPVDMDALGLTSVGIKLVEIDDTWHVFDVVGQEYYKYPADYIEETRRMGASRRLPSNLDFSKIQPGSKLVLVHAKACIENFLEYPQPPQMVCPKLIEKHGQNPLPEMCAGLWWHDFEQKDGETKDQFAVEFVRKLTEETQYSAHLRPAGIAPEYRPGIFFILPITNLAVIKGGEKTEENYQRACQSGLEVTLEEE
ncbi:MAG: hypothetical protein HPY45_09880 [Anaerolineae bacterium]|nr:hypothetical protein [Anaerolineae bacterium]